jgi:predicted MFS family arabinose efflux permease
MTARHRPVAILGVLALANLFGYAARNSLFSAYDDLRATYHLPANADRATLGFLATAFLVPHALATLPFGWSGDRFDRRRVIAFGLVLSAIAGAFGALAPTTGTLALSRALVGLGTAAIVPIGNSIIAQLFEGDQKASRMSLFNLGVFFGGLLGLGLGAVVGFPNVVWVIALPSVAIALVVLASAVPAHSTPMSAQSSRLFVADSKLLVKIRTLRWLMLSTTAMAFAAGGYVAWLIDFLQKDKQMSKDDATTLLGVTGIGAISGLLVGARLADRLRKRTPAGQLWTIAIGMSCSVPCAVACILLPAGPWLYAAGIAMMFFFSWYHAPIAVSVDDVAPPARVAAAQGLVIFSMHLIGTAPASWLVGKIADATSLYTAMWVPTGALVIAAVSMMLATPSFARDHRLARGAINLE